MFKNYFSRKGNNKKSARMFRFLFLSTVALLSSAFLFTNAQQIASSLNIFSQNKKNEFKSKTIADYCTPTNFSYRYPITWVNFAGIDNTTSDSTTGALSYEAFLDQIANLERGKTYTISVKGTNPANYNHYAVFIDWNQNGTLNDTGEYYYIGRATNEETVLTLDITVPSDALFGNTRIRVKKVHNTATSELAPGSLNNPCTGGNFGQVEDYTANISPAPVVNCEPTSFATPCPITLVNFAGINNVTSGEIEGALSYETFLDQIANLEKGKTYTISVKGTNLANSNHYALFIDWNQNGTLNDTGEYYYIGRTTNNETTLTFEVNVPEEAITGQTRLRVKMIDDASITEPTAQDFSNPCIGGISRQIEDYTADISNAQPCVAPTNLDAPDITENTAKLVWTNNRSTFDIEYGLKGFLQGTGTIISGVSNPYTLTGLNPSTEYQFYVRAICGEGEYSEWSSVFTFKTTCDNVVESFSENFDSLEPGGPTNQNYPSCWNFIQTAGG